MFIVVTNAVSVVIDVVAIVVIIVAVIAVRRLSLAILIVSCCYSCILSGLLKQTK